MTFVAWSIVKSSTACCWSSTLETEENSTRRMGHPLWQLLCNLGRHGFWITSGFTQLHSMRHIFTNHKIFKEMCYAEFSKRRRLHSKVRRAGIDCSGPKALKQTKYYLIVFLLNVFLQTAQSKSLWGFFQETLSRSAQPLQRWVHPSRHECLSSEKSGGTRDVYGSCFCSPAHQNVMENFKGHLKDLGNSTFSWLLRYSPCHPRMSLALTSSGEDGSCTCFRATWLKAVCFQVQETKIELSIHFQTTNFIATNSKSFTNFATNFWFPSKESFALEAPYLPALINAVQGPFPSLTWCSKAHLSTFPLVSLLQCLEPVNLVFGT